MKNNRIAIISSTRAEYGILYPLIKRISEDSDLSLDFIVTGTHLSDVNGHTIDEIKADGFAISHTIPILDSDNSSYGVSVTMANALKGFADCFHRDKPDMVIILGDRTEMLSVASAALNELIPVVHIHGGEVTEGAVDDCIRNAITKMSYLHFTSTDLYRKRIIQMGESPERVFNVGALSTENILTEHLDDERTLRKIVGIPNKKKYAIVTIHAETLEHFDVRENLDELCSAMSSRDDFFFVITGSNADVSGNLINSILEDYSKTHQNADFINNLGKKRYLSAVKYAAFVMGNSSSGVIEAPVLGTPTVNIGDRQKGRIMAPTVINCAWKHESILRGIDRAVVIDRVPTMMFGDGHTSEIIVNTIKNYLKKDISLKKGFYDCR